MKLRNKKTGEVVVCGEGIIEFKTFGCKNLAEFLEAGWEDYEPEEPKITDPEWRHVVRKWYKLNGLEEELKVSIDARNYMIIGWRKDEGVHGQEIDIPLSAMECGKHFFDGIRYTINELCGEGEE